MHTTRINKTLFHHDGGFDGFVEIVNDEHEPSMMIPFEDIKGFVAEWVRQEQIRELEEMSTDQLLKRFTANAAKL